MTMRTLLEVHEAMLEASTGDLSRDLSELGLGLQEVFECADRSWSMTIKLHEGRPMRPASVVASSVAEGVMLGIRYERERRR